MRLRYLGPPGRPDARPFHDERPRGEKTILWECVGDVQEVSPEHGQRMLTDMPRMWEVVAEEAHYRQPERSVLPRVPPPQAPDPEEDRADAAEEDCFDVATRKALRDEILRTYMVGAVSLEQASYRAIRTHISKRGIRMRTPSHQEMIDALVDIELVKREAANGAGE